MDELTTVGELNNLNRSILNEMEYQLDRMDTEDLIDLAFNDLLSSDRESFDEKVIQAEEVIADVETYIRSLISAKIEEKATEILGGRAYNREVERTDRIAFNTEKNKQAKVMNRRAV